MDEKRYHELLVHPALHIAKNPKNILVLGGGDGLALRELNKYGSFEKITLIDLDPKMITFSKTNPMMKTLNKDAFSNAKVFVNDLNDVKTVGYRHVIQKDIDSFKNTSRFRSTVEVINADADVVLGKLASNFYDLIIIDFPDPSSIELAKLYSKEFYLKLRRVIKKDAVIAIQATSPYHAKEAFLCIGRTLRSAGFKTVAYHHNIPSFGDWGWFLAGETIDKERIVRGFQKLDSFDVNTSYLSPKLFLASLEFGKNQLISSRKDINTLMEPALLFIYTHNAWLFY